jgi:MiaB-like tRNA modifying enzyme
MMRIYIETYGCSLNRADSQAIVTVLTKAGCEIVASPEESDVVIVNSCTVKTPTEVKILKRLKELKKLKRPIVVAGCIPQAEPRKRELRQYSQLGVFQIPNAVKVVEEAKEGNIIIALAKEDYKRQDIPHNSENPFMEIIPICQGCLGEPCSYCIVKRARGELFSYSPDAIFKRVKDAVSNGAKEIWLTAQDTGAYGKDIGTSLPELLAGVLKIEGKFWVRLGMGNPNHIKEFADELAEIFKSEKMYKFLHMPVQSGSNEILQRMNRKYSVEEFVGLVEKFRGVIPKITIATDIICGFPGETDEQFNDTLELIKRTQPEVTNISRFWPRQATPASKMPGYSGSLTKDRSRAATKLFMAIAFNNNKDWLGWSGEVLVNEKGNTWQGRNIFFKPIVIVSDENLLGKTVKAKVFDITSHDLRAKLLS